MCRPAPQALSGLAALWCQLSQTSKLLAPCSRQFHSHDSVCDSNAFFSMNQIMPHVASPEHNAANSGHCAFVSLISCVRSTGARGLHRRRCGCDYSQQLSRNTMGPRPHRPLRQLCRNHTGVSNVWHGQASAGCNCSMTHVGDARRCHLLGKSMAWGEHRNVPQPGHTLLLSQAAAALARAAVDGRAAAGCGAQRGKVLVAGCLPPLGESYSTEGGQRAAELAQPVYQQVNMLLR